MKKSIKTKAKIKSTWYHEEFQGYCPQCSARTKYQIKGKPQSRACGSSGALYASAEGYFCKSCDSLWNHTIVKPAETSTILCQKIMAAVLLVVRDKIDYNKLRMLTLTKK